MEQLSIQGFPAIDLRLNQGVNEIAGVKHRVQQIESSTAAAGGGSFNGGHHSSKKVLVEYHVINSLSTRGSDKNKYKEWNDKLVNAISQFRPYARMVLKTMRLLKNKEHDRSEIDIEIGSQPFSINGSYDYEKFNEEFYSVLVSKTEGEARSKVMKAGEGKGLEAYRMVNHWFTVTSG